MKHVNVNKYLHVRMQRQVCKSRLNERTSYRCCKYFDGIDRQQFKDLFKSIYCKIIDEINFI